MPCAKNIVFLLTIFKTTSMRRIFLGIFLFFSALVSKADGYHFLVLECNDGSSYSLPVSGLSLTFSNGNLVSSDGTTVPLEQLSKMYFSDTEAIIESKAEPRTDIAVYTISGVLVGTFADMTKATSTLPKGNYIIKAQDGRTFKTTVK